MDKSPKTASQCPGFCMRLFHCDALTFGNPIKLTVVPKDSSPKAPTLFVLSPLQPEASVGSPPASPPLDVCLAASFRPRDGDMRLNVNDSSDPISLKTDSAALHVTSGTYFYAAFTDKTLESCELHNTQAQKEHKKLPCPPKEEEREVPAPDAETCVDVYPEQAKQNFFLLLMNGVRVVFTKTLAFNTLLTIRALLF